MKVHNKMNISANRATGNISYLQIFQEKKYGGLIFSKVWRPYAEILFNIRYRHQILQIS